MKKWIAKMVLNKAWKPKTISIPKLHGKATAIKNVVDSLLKKIDDGELDASEQAELIEELIDAVL